MPGPRDLAVEEARDGRPGSDITRTPLGRKRDTSRERDARSKEFGELSLTSAPCEQDDWVLPRLGIVRQAINGICHRAKTRLCSGNPALSRKLTQRSGLLSIRLFHHTMLTTSTYWWFRFEGLADEP